jgi:hypothetical protein
MSEQNSKTSFVDRFAKAKSGNTVSQLAKSQDNQENNNSEQQSSTESQKSLNSKSSLGAIAKKTKVDPIKKAQSELIYLVTGTDRDKSAWYYVLVDRLKVRMFLQAMKSSSINLDDFGQVIYSAYGEKPPEDITNKVKEEYGIED